MTKIYGLSPKTKMKSRLPIICHLYTKIFFYGVTSAINHVIPNYKEAQNIGYYLVWSSWDPIIGCWIAHTRGMVCGIIIWINMEEIFIFLRLDKPSSRLKWAKQEKYMKVNWIPMWSPKGKDGFLHLQH